MILIFHLLTNILLEIMEKRRSSLKENQEWNISNITKQNSQQRPLAQKDAQDDIKFDPPVYKQRYERATEILVNSKWNDEIKKIVDFGSAELGLFVFLKNRVQARELAFVDIDDVLLKDHLFRVYPLNADYLVGRNKPLTVNVYSGSVSDPDPVLLNTDAIVALEIIEHLYPDVLEAIPYNFFSYIRPKLVIITTPNSDFNVLFKKMIKFRHADHKFEWSRDQFVSWATNITLRFPQYSVVFDGVGLGPEGTESLGCCSQLALFIRKDLICDNYVQENSCSCKYSHSMCSANVLNYCSCNCMGCSPKNSYGICTYQTYTPNLYDQNKDDQYYNLIFSVEYPFEIDKRTTEEKLLDELKYRMHRYGCNDEFYNYEKRYAQIPLKCLVYKTSVPFPTDLEELRLLLLKLNYQIEECLNVETNETEVCVIYEPEMESGGSGSDAEASGYGSDSNRYNADDSQLSDWDEKGLTSWANTSKAKDNEAGKSQLHLEVGNNKKQQGPLFDSGYQKSPSVPDESPHSLPVINEQPIPLGFKSLSEKPNRLSNILSVFDNFDKINELDAFRKERKYFNFSSNLPHHEIMKKLCQEIAKHPIAGPSRDNRKNKLTKKSPNSSESEDSTDEIKSLTTCIIENSLNKIECQEEELPRGDLIQELLPAEVIQEDHLQEAAEAPEPVLVENGDLANNNRDREGNNYPENHENDEMEEQNDNDFENLGRNNVNFDNNNELIFEDPVEEPEQQLQENAENADLDLHPDVEVAWSSREALFDANSQVDLLEDFDFDTTVTENVGPSMCSIVIQSNDFTTEAVLPPEDTGFPNWLLQIFEETDVEVPDDELHDEPHFYCQGDGLGVHPSIVAVNIDDENDDTDSGTDTSSSSGSAEFQSAENQPFHEIPTLPDITEDENLVIVGQSVTTSDQNNQIESLDQEVFENAEESESNLVVTSSCTD